MDFFYPMVVRRRGGDRVLYPHFQILPSADLMVRGNRFYAIWDEQKKIWSTNEFDVARIVDQELVEKVKEIADPELGCAQLRNYRSEQWQEYKRYISSMPDCFSPLDTTITFCDDDPPKEAHISHKLPYSLSTQVPVHYNELMAALYDPDELMKIEWAIGSIFAGDSINLQKFLVFYGPAGSGKSTVLNIIQRLFEGYYTTFEASVLTSGKSAFPTEMFRDNPLVAIQHDGDLSRIIDNSLLNSIVSHEQIVMHEKYKQAYPMRLNCMLFMGTNKPVRITDAKSGVVRRLIDVSPSGRKLPIDKYNELMNGCMYELGAIANRCLHIYKEMGPSYYDGYKPFAMMELTDTFFNFIYDNQLYFANEPGVSLKQAYDMYKEYCSDSYIEYKLPKYKFKAEFANYFEGMLEQKRVGNENRKNWFYGFKKELLHPDEKRCVEEGELEGEKPYLIDFQEQHSLLDDVLANCPAQYATDIQTPELKWDDVITTLSDIDTTKLHYVRPHDKHIVIDFDLKDESGSKSFERNLEAASKWPRTYAELSKSGAGIHLHYIYEGDVSQLSNIVSEGIEIKKFTGKSSLRRMLTKCNDVPIAYIQSGLPLKGEKKVIDFSSIASEKQLRYMIEKNLRKEYHSYTAPSVSYIYKLLEDAYASGIPYDVSDMRGKIISFALNSTNQSKQCINLVAKMKFKSEERDEQPTEYEKDGIVFFDVEVFPNLFIVCYKEDGPEHKCVRMINPTAADLELLFTRKLVGFNNRRYDNHILYARYIGYSLEELYQLSQRIINAKASDRALFQEAFRLSYTDIYDFSSAANRKSLKKWEIELGIHHQELNFPWDQPVPEDKWPLVADYCCNDVLATEAVFHHLSADWTARVILAEMSGLTPNDGTTKHAAKIIFGDDRNPQSKFVYTDLSTMFPGYKYSYGKSTYKGREVNEGGYVYAEPGMYVNIGLLDIASMHPKSIEMLNLFGPYTKNFTDIRDARIAIKHQDRDTLLTMLDGKMQVALDKIDRGECTYEDLSNAMKTVINRVYGLTFASFDNPFRDPRNKDNIVAKRGALFMVDLLEAVQAKGFTVAHIKTDSIKIPNATQDIIQFVQEFGHKYGYEFEHEATYAKMCLVNNAVYIAKYDERGQRNKGNKHANEWTATGAQFAHPYVFKTLFSKENIIFEDLCETKSVSVGNMYLDMNEDLPEGDHEYVFVGRVGSFCPIPPGKRGGLLLREDQGKYSAVTGTLGYRWLEAEVVDTLGIEVDMSYFRKLADDAVEAISKFGDFEWFATADCLAPPWFKPDNDEPPF